MPPDTLLTDAEIGDAYDHFCEELGYRSNKINPILEFALFIGSDILRQGYLQSPVVAQKIKMLQGPHNRTILAAYKIQRGTVKRRLTAFPLKVHYAAIFAKIVAHDTLRDIFQWLR